MKNLKLYFITLFLLLTCNVCLAQLYVNCAGKKYIIPNFKADSAFSYTNKFVTNTIVPSIKNSGYDLEIRLNMYGGFGWPGEGHCVVIRGNRDSLFAVDYFLKFDDEKPGQSSSSSINIRDLSMNDTVARPKLRIRSLNLVKPLAELLQTLIDNHIMDVPDNNALIKTLKEKNITLKPATITDCCSSVYYEVKVNNEFRNFSANYFYQAENQNIKELQYHLNIGQVFAVLVPNFFK